MGRGPHTRDSNQLRCHMKRLLYLLMGVFVVAGCDSGPNEEDTSEAPRTVVPYTEGVRIAWDARTLTEVYDGNSSYPRMIRLDNGDLLVAYVHYVGEAIIQVQRSTDDGETWSEPVVAARDSRSEVTTNNPELIQLENGEVLLPHGVRANGNPEANYELRVRASQDGGQSWESRSTVYVAGQERRRGIWEPVIRQLPSGDLQLYAANECPYDASNDQEISMWHSSDDGQSWSEEFVTTSYREGWRDGMPVPVVLNNGNGIVYAIESNGWNEQCWRLKPTIIWSPSVENAWANAPVLHGDDEYRWRALASEAQLSCDSRGTAPYLVQFPQGETVLSFHSQQGRLHSGQTMMVAVGDQNAKNFRFTSVPFSVPDEEEHRVKWSSLFQKHETTVTAVTSTSAFNGDRGGGFKQIYTVDGHRIPDPTVLSGSVTVDGEAEEDVWQQTSMLPVGRHGEKVTETKLATDQEQLYARFQVYDGHVATSDGLSEGDDAVLLEVAPEKLTRNLPVDGTFQLKVEADGDFALRAGQEGNWTAVPDASIEVATSNQSPFTSRGFDGVQYTVEVGIPWADIGGRPPVGQGWGLNIGLVDTDGRETLTREWIEGSSPRVPSTWRMATIDG